MVSRMNKGHCFPMPMSVWFLVITTCQLTTSDMAKRAFRGISTLPVMDLKVSNTSWELGVPTTSPSLHSADKGSTSSGMPIPYNLNMLSSAGPSLSLMENVPTPLPTKATNSNERSTNAPTVSSPSSLLGSAPTMRCHDKPTYKSPINALTCEDHRGTNCAHWHYLGLNTTQLARLIEDCPVTCRVPCGSFLQFSVTLGFTLVAVPGLMDAATKQELEVVTWQYLLAFSRATLDRQVAFEFDYVELLSQAILGDMPRIQNDDLHLSLVLRMQFQGFTIGVSSDDVSKLLQAGISSHSYQVVLTEVDEFFSEAMISSSLEQETAFLETMDKDERSSFPLIMVASMFAGLATMLGISWCMNSTRSTRLLSKIDILPRSEIDEHFQLTSLPGPSETKTPFPILYEGSPLSLDDSRASTFHTGNGVLLTRSIAGQRLTVNASSSSSDQDELTQKVKCDQNIACAGVSSESVDVPSAQPEEDAEMEHPLSQVIPPMIIFDDIDDNPDGPPDPPFDPEPPQVPAVLIKASNDLISFLRRGKVNADPSILDTLNQKWTKRINTDSFWRHSEDNCSLSRFGLEMDSDSDSDSHNEDAMPDHNNSRVDAEMFALSRPSLCSDVLEDLQDADLDLFQIPPRNLSLDLNPMEKLSTLSEERAYYDSPLVNDERKTSEASGKTQAHDPPKWAISSSACDEESKSTPVQLSTPVQTHERLQISLSAGTKHKRRWTFSPLSRSHHDTLLKLGKGGSVTKTPDLVSPWKIQLTPAFLERQSLEMESFGNSDDLPSRHEFEAPRNGQLGLVVEPDDFTGLVVYSVKDYSPLLGLVQEGDKIVQVDGKNTFRCSLADMSRLVSTKPGILLGSPTNLKIVVLRPPHHCATNSQPGDASPSQTHSRTSTGSFWSPHSRTNCSTSMPNLGITTSSSEEKDTSHLNGFRSMRNVRFVDELKQGRTLFHHKVRGSF